jgi:hypothetical protein
VAALHPAVTTVAVPAIWVAPTEASTRTISAARGTPWFPVVEEATVPVQAMATAEVPVTNSGKVERATEIGAAMLPGHKVSKGKNKFR